MNNYVFEMLHPWVACSINMWYLSTKSQHKQQGDDLFSWNSRIVTYCGEHSKSWGQRSRRWCPPSPFSMTSGLLRVNSHCLPNRLLISNKLLLCITCVMQKYFCKCHSAVRYFVVSKGLLNWNSQRRNVMIDECYFRLKDNCVFKMSPINPKWLSLLFE